MTRRPARRARRGRIRKVLHELDLVSRGCLRSRSQVEEQLEKCPEALKVGDIGCTGRVLFQLLTDWVPYVAYPLVGFTGFVEFSALLWWGIELWRTMNLAKQNRAKLLTAPLPLAAS